MMYTESNPPCKLSLEMYGNKVSFKFPGSDCGADEILRAFCGIMISQGFQPSTVDRVILDLSMEIDRDKEDEAD